MTVVWVRISRFAAAARLDNTVYLSALGTYRHLAVGSLILSSLLVSAQTQPQFYQTLAFQGGPAIVTADFNNDGKLDLANGNAVLLGNGDGTFKSTQPLSVPGPVIASADFNSDGKPDLVVVPQAGTSFSVLLGNGDGTFQTAQNTNVGASFSAVVGIDINGDGKPDILGAAGGSVFVLLGNGDGTFKPATVYPAGPIFNDLILTGDFNSDGKLDILIVGGGNDLAVLLGNGDGTFRPAINSTPGLSAPVGVAVGDLNHDGKLDLIWAVSDLASTQTSLLLGKGDGTFQAPSAAISVAGPLAVYDLDGDGNLDLVMQACSPAVCAVSPLLSIFKGNGDGTFTHTHDYALNFNASGSNNVVVADFNNDGHVDLAVSSSMLLGHGDGTFAAASALGTMGNLVSSGVAGDFNRDGFADMAISEGNSALEILLADATGTFTLAHSYSVPGLGGEVTSSDLNLDGKLDLAFTIGTVVGSTSAFSLGAMLGNGDGSFAAPLITPQVDNSSPGQLVVADFNGDHNPDVAVPQFPPDRIQSGSVLIFLGNGDGTFATPVSYFAGEFPSNAVTGDFNNDGKIDIAVSSSAGVGILMGNGDGTFQMVSFPMAASSSVSFAADVNGDGKVDFVGSNGGQLQVWLGNGDGTFKALAPIAAAAGVVAAVADFNGDGNLDILLNSANGPRGGGVLYLFMGNGDGTFGSPITITSTAAGPFSFVTVGDFNKDRRTDIAVSFGPLVTVFQAPIGGVFPLLNVTPADFSISSAPPSVSISSPGQSGTATVTVTTAGGFAGTVNLGCSVSPSNQMNPPTCTLTPNSVNIGSTSPSATAMLNIGTTPSVVGNMRSHDRNGSTLLAWASTSIALACFVLLFVPKGRGSSLLVLVPLALLLPIAGCGGGSSSRSGTAPGTYTVTVTAASGAVSHVTKVSIAIP
jgi:hypothetical protein